MTRAAMLVRIRTGKGGRLAATAVFALHLLLAAALPLADADVEATAATVPNVRLRGDGADASEQRPHDPVVCQFCLALNQAAVTMAGAARTAGPAQPVTPSSPIATDSFPSTASPLPLGSRAPPQA